MNESVRATMSDLADAAEIDYRIMPSGGGHDAMNFEHASIPAGLVFVPSIDGVSHNPDEETTERAIEAGTTLLAVVISESY